MEDFIKVLLSQGPFVVALSFVLIAIMRGNLITKREADDLHVQIERIKQDRDKWRDAAERGTGLAVRGADVVEQAVQKAAAELLRGQRETAEALKLSQKETAADLLRRAAALQQAEDREKGLG